MSGGPVTRPLPVVGAEHPVDLRLRSVRLHDDLEELDDRGALAGRGADLFCEDVPLLAGQRART